ncbi:hypothetical protein [Massilia yuzhufengensis]|uniref:Uncharacterized protein n=1 Tax=Massilia yuzhufengensis TaxID=1164594 RepID=A0A1I1S5X0_9BURK|nr:hypothetical protein [Massilia yuzhufengensis]SFD41909.1 hypothetical protein SAMN05216204_12482 [Massilia yuzhufengensis]
MNNIQLGLRTLGLIALVVFSTAVLVNPELIGGSTGSTALAIGSIPVVGHH